MACPSTVLLQPNSVLYNGFLTDVLSESIYQNLHVNIRYLLEIQDRNIFKASVNQKSVGVIYRPPNMDVNLFLNTFNETLGKISKENKICNLMGDFNLNLMNYGKFLDGLYSNAFVPVITCPTRITSHTATLIDNIFTNHYFESASGLLLTDISDHLPIFSICLMDPSYKDRNETILVRDKCPNNEIRFKEQLMNNSWFQLEGINDPKTAYKTFFNKFSEFYNNCFQFR